MGKSYSKMSHSDSNSDTDSISGSDTDSNEYKCDPGLCVIMNNMVFNKPQLGELTGGERDEEDLKKLFKKLGFTVMIHKNLTAKEMKSTAEGYSCMKHCGIFFLIILSHGGEGDVVYGTDGKEVEVHQLKELFYATNCRSLARKPKVFMIDACRGSRNERVYHPETKCATKSPNRRGSVTDSADVYTIFASTRGTTAGIDSELGSHLTRNFVNVVTEADCGKKFEEIMTEVKGRIHTTKIQTAETNSTFTKFYYIKRYQVTHEALKKRFAKTVRHWLPVREETIKQVRETATELEKHRRNVNISRITGSAVSTGGTAAIITGFALAPVTLGVSFALSIVGAGASVAGGATAAGASIADTAIQKDSLKKIKKQIDYDNLQVEVIRQMAEDIQEEIKHTQDSIQVGSAAAIATQAVTGAARIGNVGMKTAELTTVSTLKIGAAALRVGTAAAKGIAGAALALSIITIPIDLAEIIRSGHNLKKGSQTEAVEKLNTFAVQLEEQMESIKKGANIE